jgi:hypothetical protein
VNNFQNVRDVQVRPATTNPPSASPSVGVRSSHLLHFFVFFLFPFANSAISFFQITVSHLKPDGSMKAIWAPSESFGRMNERIHAALIKMYQPKIITKLEFHCDAGGMDLAIDCEEAFTYLKELCCGDIKSIKMIVDITFLSTKRATEGHGETPTKKQKLEKTVSSFAKTLHDEFGTAFSVVEASTCSVQCNKCKVTLHPNHHIGAIRKHKNSCTAVKLNEAASTSGQSTLDPSLFLPKTQQITSMTPEGPITNTAPDSY